LNLLIGELKSRPERPDRDYHRVVSAWTMYDWANSAFAVIVLTAVFPVYYRALVMAAGGSSDQATAYWAYTTSASQLIVALIGPALGAIADIVHAKKRFLAIAVVLGVSGSIGLAFLGHNTFLLASIVFAFANLGFAGGNIFYDALLPDVARPDDVDRVSARGYALGYLGGGLLLLVNVVWLVWPHWFMTRDREFALRASFVSVALWWLIFALPLFRHVSESGQSSQLYSSERMIKDGLRRLACTFRQIRRYRQLALFLMSFWLYNDGVSTIIKIAAAYGDELGIGHRDMLIALVLTQFIGFPSTLGFGMLVRYISAKRSILLGIGIYMLVSIGGFFMTSVSHFYVLAIVVGLIQGGTQALSRSLFATMVPKTRSTEFFGFFSTGEKVAGLVGPAVFGLLAQLTGSSRWGIISVTLLFALGAVLLTQVDEQEGRAMAAAVG
jgi:UMF1 family MFS transporter